MGYIATDIATVPSINGEGEPFNWYIFFLPGPLNNQIRMELIENFFRLSRLIGKENLAIIGEDFDEFHSDVIRRYALYLQDYDERNIPLPSLLVTDTAPGGVEVEAENINAKAIQFPLGQAYLRDGMLTDFLRQLCATLQDVDAFESLDELREQEIFDKWGWVNQYFDLKPNFFGLGIDLNAILDAFLNRDS